MRLLNQYIFQRLLLFTQTLGHSPEDLCAQAGVDYNAMINESRHLDDIESENLWRVCIKETGKPELGFHLGLQINIEAIGLLGMMLQNAQTIEQAVILATKYIPLASDLISLEYCPGSKISKINIRPKNALIAKRLPYRSQQVCLITLAFTIKIYNLLTLKNLKLEVVGFPSFIKNRNIARAYITGPSVVTKNNYYLSAKTSILKSPIVNADFEALSQLRSRAQILLTEESKIWTKRVEHTLINQYDGHFMRLFEVASQLNIGVRTLQRHLDKENNSFNKILNGIKKSIAQANLIETRNIAKTAAILGFSDSSSFGKAFKNWVGQTPFDFINKSKN